MELEELKNFVGLHAKSQNLNAVELAALMDRIREPCGNAPHSWVREWMDLGESHLTANRLDKAMQCFNFARFPYVDSPERQCALNKCVETFESLSLRTGRSFRDLVQVAGVSVPVYFSGVTSRPKPLLIVIGGIVSIKEQWRALLLLGPRLGYTTALAECPGVGENPLIYGQDSAAFLSAIIDHYTDKVLSGNVVILGLSFGGHLAIRAALTDNRIKKIITVGAPIYELFSNQHWWDQVPNITKETLAHLARQDQSVLFDAIRAAAIHEEELARLTIPLTYVLSERDEIIPPAEGNLLRRNVSNLTLVSFDDVHGAPNYLSLIRQMFVRDLARHNKVGFGIVERLLGLSILVARLRHAAKGRPTAAVVTRGVH
jgi:esterase FrsA